MKESKIMNKVNFLIANRLIKGFKRGKVSIIIGIILATSLLAVVLTVGNSISETVKMDIIEDIGDYHISYDNLEYSKIDIIKRSPLIEELIIEGRSVKIQIKEKGGIERNIDKLANTLGEKPNVNEEYFKYLNREGQYLINEIYRIGIMLGVIGVVLLITYGNLYNGFSLSMSDIEDEIIKLKQIGATPKQIKEILIIIMSMLIVIAVPIGFFIGVYGVEIIFYGLGKYINAYKDIILNKSMSDIIIVFVLISILSISAIIKVSKNNNKEEYINIGMFDYFIKDKIGIEGLIAYRSRSINYNKYTKLLTSISVSITFLVIIGTVLNVMGVPQLHSRENEDVDISLHTVDEKVKNRLEEFKVVDNIYISNESIEIKLKDNAKEEDLDEFMEELYNGVGKPYTMEDIKGFKEFEKRRASVFKLGGYGFAIFIGIIALINIVNIIFNDVESKKEQMRLLMSVGCSYRVIKKIILYEVLVNISIGSVLGLIIGLMIGGIIPVSNNVILSGELPVKEFVCAFVIIQVIGIITASSTIKSIKGKSCV